MKTNQAISQWGGKATSTGGMSTMDAPTRTASTWSRPISQSRVTTSSKPSYSSSGAGITGFAAAPTPIYQGAGSRNVGSTSEMGFTGVDPLVPMWNMPYNQPKKVEADPQEGYDYYAEEELKNLQYRNALLLEDLGYDVRLGSGGVLSVHEDTSVTPQQYGVTPYGEYGTTTSNLVYESDLLMANQVPSTSFQGQGQGQVQGQRGQYYRDQYGYRPTWGRENYYGDYQGLGYMPNQYYSRYYSGHSQRYNDYNGRDYYNNRWKNNRKNYYSRNRWYR